MKDEVKTALILFAISAGIFLLNWWIPLPSCTSYIGDNPVGDECGGSGAFLLSPFMGWLCISGGMYFLGLGNREK